MDDIQNQIDMLKNQITELQMQMKEHYHDGLQTKKVNAFDLLGSIPSSMVATTATIPTTTFADTYVICPISGTLTEVTFSGVDALAANDTNYISWTITNLGSDGTGTTVMLTGGNTNTTRVTGGAALAANTKRTLSLSTTYNVLTVNAGDRLYIKAAANGTLANTVTFPTYILKFSGREFILYK